MNRLDALKARVASATKGPWTNDGDFGVASREDAMFIAHAREDIERLVAVVETLEPIRWILLAENIHLASAVLSQRELVVPLLDAFAYWLEPEEQG